MRRGAERSFGRERVEIADLLPVLRQRSCQVKLGQQTQDNEEFLTSCQGNLLSGVPIPGTKRREYLEENIGAIAIELSSSDLARLDQIAPAGFAAGLRYNEDAMRLVAS